MKVKIGPYLNWIGPYQIAKMIMFWEPERDADFNTNEKVHNFGKWLAKKKDGSDTWLTKFCQWIHDKRKRKIKVKLEPHDTWNMDSTLAIIILPMLKQLNATKHGYPHADCADAPEEFAGVPDEEGHDPKAADRWQWILNEMIWAFEQLQPDYDWEEQYRSGNLDIKWTPITDENGKVTSYQMDRGPNDTYVCDYEALKKHSKRIDNGLRLFGVYFRSLWD